MEIKRIKCNVLPSRKFSPNQSVAEQPRECLSMFTRKQQTINRHSDSLLIPPFFGRLLGKLHAKTASPVGMTANLSHEKQAARCIACAYKRSKSFQYRTANGLLKTGTLFFVAIISCPAPQTAMQLII